MGVYHWTGHEREMWWTQSAYTQHRAAFPQGSVLSIFWLTSSLIVQVPQTVFTIKPQQKSCGKAFLLSPAATLHPHVGSLSDRLCSLPSAHCCYLVEVAKPHPLHCWGFPLWQRWHKLHCWGLLLQHSQGQSAQHSITLINEGLAGGSGVYSYHFTAWKGEKKNFNRAWGKSIGLKMK